MQFLALATLLLVARVSAEQSQEVSNAQPVPVQVVPGQVVQNGPVVGQAGPSMQEVASQNQHHPQPVVHTHQHGGQTYPGEQHPGPHYPQPSQYAPSGIIQVVSAADGKPYSTVAGQQQRQYSAEQYGQPESTGIPANYKPFGSWGLYIGGNPTDGYYSSYYKALGNSVDKQQVSQEKPVVGSAGPVGQASGFGPMLKQANVGGPSYGSYQDQVYPFESYYTTSDFNTIGGPSSYSAGRISPVQVGAQVYGSPMPVYGAQDQAPVAYADQYATKRVGASSSSFSQRPESQYQQSQQPTPKGYQQQMQQQQRVSYAYSSGVIPNQAVPQVVAYPVPVGSQIVGSQPGTEGAYQPYGVHGYTRYAVKPTVVASEQSSHYPGVNSSPVSQFPAYKQQGGAYQPLGFYGYPLNQLHYSQGSIVPAFPSGEQAQVAGEHHQVVGSQGAGPVQGMMVGVHESPVPMHSPAGPVEAASSEKSETESHSTVNKQKQQLRRA